MNLYKNKEWNKFDCIYTCQISSTLFLKFIDPIYIFIATLQYWLIFPDIFIFNFLLDNSFLSILYL